MDISYQHHYSILNKLVDEDNEVKLDYDFGDQDHLMLLAQFMRSARSDTTDFNNSSDNKTVEGLIESAFSEDLSCRNSFIN